MKRYLSRRIGLCLAVSLMLFQYSFASTYYVSTTGNDASGDGSAANPWKTLRYAVTRVAASQGHTIQVGAGIFVEGGLIEVPLGVSVTGAGVDATIFKAVSSFYYHPSDPGYATNKFLISLTGFSPVKNGNQSLSNFTVDGDSKQLHGGIYVHYRSNVVIDQVKVQNTNFTGIWLWDVTDSKLINTQLVNCSWGSTGYCSGALNVGNLQRVEISQLNVDENTGYGVKAIGPDGYNDIFYLKFHDSHISVNPFGLWNNGSAPNIAIELWNSTLMGSEIYNTYVDNTISLVNSAIPSTGVQTIRVHDNILDMDARAHGSGYGLELSVHDAEVDHNYFYKGNYGIANWDNPMQNWDIHHNTFYALSSIYPGEMVRSQWSGLHNVKFYNNTVEFTGTSTMSVIGVYGGSSNDIDIKNNLIVNSNTGYNYYPNQLLHTEPGATVARLTVLNNSTTGLDPGSLITSLLGLLNPLINLNVLANPAVTKSGSRPAQYYMPAAGSSLINAGLNVGYAFMGSAPDIGAYESGSTNSLPQVNITSPAGNASFTTGSQVTINAAATDSDGTISKVEFFLGATKLGEDLTSPYSFGWTNVPAGSYSLTARATDNLNAVTTSAAIAITISNANVSPAASITSPANNANFASASTITINATASDSDGTISKLEFFQGATKLGEDLSSPYSFAWTNVPAGSYSLTTRATDNLNAVTTSAAIAITVSNANVAPAASITNPANNANFASTSTITINATASDSDGTISKVEFFQGATKLGEDLTSPYSFDWTNVPAGAYSITIKATDNLSAVSTSAAIAISVSSANVAPTASITSPANNASFVTGSNVMISAIATDSDGTVSKVEFFHGAAKLGEDLSSPYTFDWTNVQAGAYSITIKATDNLNAVTTSAAIAISVSSDNIAPTAGITSPANNATFIAGSKVTIYALATDSDGSVVKVEFFQGATKLGQDVTSPYAFAWTTVPAGNYSITVKATDNGGAVTTSPATAIVVAKANRAPGAYISSPANNAVFTTGSSITIMASASDPDGTIVKVEFFEGLTRLGEDTSKPYRYTLSDMPTGVYLLTIKATDNRGAVTTSAAVTIKVNTAPSITVTGPANNTTFVAGSPVTITASATDADGTISKVEFFSGTVKLGEVTQSPYVFTWSSPSPGSYSLSASATDNLDVKTTSAAVGIIINNSNSAPVVSITSPTTAASFAPGAIITINADAIDSDGLVAKVEFFQGATKLGESLTSPYGFAWSNVPPGSYSLTARATDNVGATTVSDVITISVVNPATTFQLGLYAPDAMLSGSMTLTTDATASRGSYFSVPAGNGTNYYIPPSSTATFNFQLPKTDTYFVWARVKSPAPENQGYFVYDGKGNWFSWEAGVHTQWAWVKLTNAETGSVASMAFSQGINEIQFGWNHDNTEIDQLLVTNDASLVPAEPVIVSQLQVFPNPIADSFTIQYSSPVSQQAQVSIYNQSGTLIWQTAVSMAAGPNSVTLGTVNISDGTYILMLTPTTSGDTGTARIVIAR